MKNLLLWVWLCILVSLSFSSKAVDCSTTTVGLCNETVDQVIVETITETVEIKPDGILTTTTTEKEITTTTIENKSSGDILDPENDFVTESKSGSLQTDWGGQGPASMHSGSKCNNLGTDYCGEITGGSNFTSTMGVENVGTTFIQTVDISELNIKYGGQTNYLIKVDKQDAQDSVYMHITGKDGSTDVFSGTDILSASGTNSGYQMYESSFDFSGSLTTLIIEVGGRDINLQIGPLFSDTRIEVLYNVINTIVTQSIESVEMFVALNIDASEDVINVVENVFDSNIAVETDVGLTFEPIDIQEPSYEEIEIEIAEIEITEIELEIEAELEANIDEKIEKVEVVEDVKEPESQQEETIKQEAEKESEPKIKKIEKLKTKEVEEQKEETEKNESSKEKAAKKVMKKISDKKRYDNVAQTKTLIVMQVLGDSKSFFADQQQLNDRIGFFTDKTLPDAIINDNDLASYFLFVGSDGLMNEMIESQWQN